MTDKGAIVTGGTRGIGLAIAKRLADDGWNLLLTYRGDDEAAKAAEQELAGSSGNIKVIAGDIANADDAGRIIEEGMAHLGKIDALVNNAGITRDTLMMRMSEDDWDAVPTPTSRARSCSKAVMRPMLRLRGRIVSHTSVVGLVGNAGGRCSARAGLVGLKTMAREVGSRGITVMRSLPGSSTPA